jgi:hypothetical protein
MGKSSELKRKRKMKGKQYQKFVWCLHCERAFPEKDSRNKMRCAYFGCDGHWGDIWEWETVRSVNPDYPVIPEKGKVYLLYPPKKNT